MIGRCDVKHIMMLQIKSITYLLKVSINIITDHAIRLTVILAIMSVSTIISGSRCCSIFGFLCSVL